jgi:AcrR family transcriptional regulator
MGISERREREKYERRKAILDCAKELILSHGVEQVSMEDVARKAELSKATVYLYFSGKEALFNEICEDSARTFLERFNPTGDTGLTGIETMRYFWRCYVEQFGNSDEMFIVFHVRNFLNSWLPGISLAEENKSPYVDVILNTVRNIIDRCKTEGVFDLDLDSSVATRLLLSMFSVIVERAARMPPEARRSPSVLNEMTSTFRIILGGFAKEGIDRSCLDIASI